ncbi:LacI family DNA-binding transcriptional regulator [Bifidobacterium sp. SMB2]|uniref:LacI family DNA-binding transcriptional regulator n=1 Tax=Bifidobacterium saimiriisciurei TaxID=2661627 RepID=A0ABX0C8G2_9BIFI|nr:MULTISPECIES: LacI family DNA-binding transcriptional regulator [Bifidobacterium]NEG96372.1 LacI family DNA-binding transcriptional regulator [Bifidobacterium sp. SMB2]NEH10996.1 LacI family DNA-binding transcriptional regulator [Bifidobacterium saimiriisciurei]
MSSVHDEDDGHDEDGVHTESHGDGREAAPVTITDVAEAAGVSIATVSRTFRYPDRVNVRTLNHVRAVAERLGYHAQAIRPRVESRLAGLISLTVNDLGNPVYSQIARAVQRECSRRNFGLMISETEESPDSERAIVTRAIPHVDGMILCAPRLPDATIRKLAQSRPLAVMNRAVGGVQSMYADDGPAIMEAVDALAKLGHREVTYIAGTRQAWQNGLRTNAMQAACRRAGLRLRRTSCAYPVGPESQEAFEGFLARPTSAAVAYNDEVAYAFMTFLEAHGLSVPDDVSVVGIDDIPMCEVCSPKLASIAVPRQELAREAARRIIGQVLHSGDDALAPVVLRSGFVWRASIGEAAR